MEPLTLTELGQRVAGRWPTLVVMAVIGLAAGMIYHLASPTEYQAEAVLRVDAADPARVDMAAEAALASSRQVTQEALDILERPDLTIEDIESAATATAVPDSRVLRVTFVADSPAAAARGADAIANSYLVVRDKDADRWLDVEKATASTADVVDPARTPTNPTGLGASTTAITGLALGLLVAVPVAARPRRLVGRRVSDPDTDSVK